MKLTKGVHTKWRRGENTGYSKANMTAWWTIGEKVQWQRVAKRLIREWESLTGSECHLRHEDCWSNHCSYRRRRRRRRRRRSTTYRTWKPMLRSQVYYLNDHLMVNFLCLWYVSSSQLPQAGKHYTSPFCIFLSAIESALNADKCERARWNELENLNI